MKMLYIRVDGNEKIATGHIMRCLSIARELGRQGEDVVFILADDRPKDLISKYGFEIICLESVWDDMNQEIEKMVALIKERKISFLLIDSYFVTEEYLIELKRHTRIAYIDDIDRFVYPVDYLVNYNMYAKSLNYEKRYREAGLYTEFFLGCSYAPLRDEFKNVQRKVRREVNKIFVTTGGTDQYNVAGHFLERVKEYDWFETLKFKVIIGTFNKNREVLLEQWKYIHNVHLLTNVSNMAEYMKDCDVAIAAGGVTTYELCACGIPSIMYTLADNQLEIARAVSADGLMPWVGDVRNDLDMCIDRILEYLISYQNNYEKRKAISKKMQSCIDGMGCQRLTKVLLERIHQEKFS